MRSLNLKKMEKMSLIEDEYLDALERKTKWSGFSRDKGVTIILKLIEEIRTLKELMNGCTGSTTSESK